MIRYVFLGFALTAAIVGFRLMTSESTSDARSPANQASSQLADNQTAIKQTPQTNSAPPNLVAPQNSEPSEASDWEIANNTSNSNDQETEQFDNAQFDAIDSVQDSPWSEPEDSPPLPDKYQRIGVTARALSIDHEKISKLRSGDEIELAIPQLNQSYQMRVESVKKHSNGDRSLKGHIADSDQVHSVVMTEGPNITFATINTPQGSYTLEAKGNQGWMMSAADLDYLIDPSQNDFLIPQASD